MIGLILLYFIGKAFYQLAHDSDKSRWGFAILGIISYYAGSFAGGIIFGIIGGILQSDFFSTIPDILLGLLCMPFGLLTCWGFYKILEMQWSKETVTSDNERLKGN